jgi:hypothetical protein
LILAVRLSILTAAHRRLTTAVAERCEQKAPNRWLWHGRQVLLADGSTASAPHTAENQAEHGHGGQIRHPKMVRVIRGDDTFLRL